MKILIIDEDERQMPQVCDLLEQLGHKILQVKDWHEVEDAIKRFSPDGIVLDLMIPAIGLPADECAGGFTTGVYLYNHIIHSVAPNVPFIVYSGTAIDVNMIKEDVDSLKKYKEFKGILGKGSDEDLIIEMLQGNQNV